MMMNVIMFNYINIYIHYPIIFFFIFCLHSDRVRVKKTNLFSPYRASHLFHLLPASFPFEDCTYSNSCSFIVSLLHPLTL